MRPCFDTGFVVHWLGVSGKFEKPHWAGKVRNILLSIELENHALTPKPTKSIDPNMVEVLDAPPFTDPNKAREAGLRSAELRKQQATENETLRALLATKPITDFQTAKPVNEEVNRQIELTNELVAHARDELKRLQSDDYGFCEHCKRHGADAKEQAALLRELRGLMEHLCRLHNIAQAPTSRVNPKPQRRTEPMPEPTPAIPTPTATPSTPAVPGGS